jgi:hypothetical protein
MRPRFFPLSSEEEIVNRTFLIAQEFHIHDENMLVSRFLWLSDKIPNIHQAKAKAVEAGEVYIGG